MFTALQAAVPSLQLCPEGRISRGKGLLAAALRSGVAAASTFPCLVARQLAGAVAVRNTVAQLHKLCATRLVRGQNRLRSFIG